MSEDVHTRDGRRPRESTSDILLRPAARPSRPPEPPPAPAREPVELSIDGVAVTVPAGSTILEA